MVGIGGKDKTQNYTGTKNNTQEMYRIETQPSQRTQSILYRDISRAGD